MLRTGLVVLILGTGAFLFGRDSKVAMDDSVIFLQAVPFSYSCRESTLYMKQSGVRELTTNGYTKAFAKRIAAPLQQLCDDMHTVVELDFQPGPSHAGPFTRPRPFPQ